MKTVPLPKGTLLLPTRLLAVCFLSLLFVSDVILAANNDDEDFVFNHSQATVETDNHHQTIFQTQELHQDEEKIDVVVPEDLGTNLRGSHQHEEFQKNAQQEQPKQAQSRPRRVSTTSSNDLFSNKKDMEDLHDTISSFSRTEDEERLQESFENRTVVSSSFSGLMTDKHEQQERMMTFEQIQHSPGMDQNSELAYNPQGTTAYTESSDHHHHHAALFSSNTKSISTTNNMIEVSTTAGGSVPEVAPASGCQLKLHVNPPGISNWYDANNFCKKQGGAGSRLARLKEYCPRGRNVDPVFGRKDGNQWSPYFEDKNGWVNVGTWPGGNRETCITHLEGGLHNPFWGSDSRRDYWESNYLYCYECPGTCSFVLNNIKNQGVNTWDQTKAFCEGKGTAGSRLATFDEYCTAGMYKSPAFGKGNNDEWAAMGDYRNAWVQIGSFLWNQNTCMSYLTELGHKPQWGLENREKHNVHRVYCFECSGGSVENIDEPQPTSMDYTMNGDGATLPYGFTDAVFDAGRLSILAFDRGLKLGAQENEVIRYNEGFDLFEVFYRMHLNTRIDQSIVAKSRGVCFGVFSGTEATNLNDWLQNMDFGTSAIEAHGKTCWARRGFYEGYVNEYRQSFDDSLHKCLQSCGDSDCPLVITGGSQGGAIAVVASAYWKHKNPITYTFGAPRSVFSGCELLDTSKHYRFIVTGPIAFHHMGYDYVVNSVPAGNFLFHGPAHYGYPILLADKVQYNKSPVIYERNNDWNLDPSSIEIHNLDTYLREGISIHYHSLINGPLTANKWDTDAPCREHFQCRKGSCIDWKCS